MIYAKNSITPFPPYDELNQDTEWQNKVAKELSLLLCRATPAPPLQPPPRSTRWLNGPTGPHGSVPAASAAFRAAVLISAALAPASHETQRPLTISEPRQQDWMAAMRPVPHS